MTKENYMALEDFQTLWTEKIKPTLYNRTQIDGMAMKFEETSDPTSEESVDEFRRITAALYQALADSQQVISPAQQAAAQAADKAAAANRAATAANTAAQRASDAAGEAMDAAAEVDTARGDYDSLGERLEATEMGLIETTDQTTLML